jgi:hypothetical protein
MTSSPFKRDRLTWLLYLLLGFYAFMQAALGPIVPFLRAELNLSYTVTGFHVSAFALGCLVRGSRQMSRQGASGGSVFSSLEAAAWHWGHS